MDNRKKGRQNQLKNKEDYFIEIQKKVNNLNLNQTKEIGKLKQQSLIYNMMSKVEENLYFVGKEDEQFEDTFNYFMDGIFLIYNLRTYGVINWIQEIHNY